MFQELFSLINDKKKTFTNLNEKYAFKKLKGLYNLIYQKFMFFFIFSKLLDQLFIIDMLY